MRFASTAMSRALAGVQSSTDNHPVEKSCMPRESRAFRGKDQRRRLLALGAPGLAS